MKSAFIIALAFWLLQNGVSFAADTDQPGELENPCTPILLACEDKGYTYDPVAEPGQKIWADCADPIINQNQPVRGLTIDPLRLKTCRQFKQSRRWESDWQSTSSGRY